MKISGMTAGPITMIIGLLICGPAAHARQAPDASGLTSNGEQVNEPPEQLTADQRRERVAVLMAEAQANDDKGRGWLAIVMLDELLELDPAHVEARKLREKIRGTPGNPGNPVTPVKHGNRRTIDFGSGVTGEFVFIEPGKFMMGSPEGESDRGENELQHEVTLTKGYWMATTEITQAQFRAVLGNNPSNFTGDDRRPVEQVTWHEAADFCRKFSVQSGLKFRLPTEAQWEYACRAGTTTPFNTGPTISTEQANINGYSTYGNHDEEEFRNQTLLVRSFDPNAWGLFDMHGNVWEWCQDGYGEYQLAATDPKSRGSGQDRILRGGGWNVVPKLCRSAMRDWCKPDVQLPNIGFRLTLEP